MKRPEDLFIRSEKEFKFYQNLVDHVFDTNKEIPQQVFRKTFDCFLFQEFDWALSDEILPTIKELSFVTQDREFLTAVLQPDPTAYYFKEFGYYPWVKIPLNHTPSDYLDLLTDYPIESVNDSIMDIASRVIWVSPSAKWIIYGERGYEIGVLAILQLEQMNKQLLKTWRTLDEIVLGWISVVFSNQKLPDDFKKELIRNYKNVV